MIRTFCVGLAAEPPRLFVTAEQSEAELQVLDGEVCFTQANFPEAPHRISDDGLSLIALELDPEIVTSEKWTAIKLKRNALLDYSRWSIALDSPLTPACQIEWLAYLKSLNRLTIDFTDPNNVIWPSVPAMDFD